MINYSTTNFANVNVKRTITQSRVMFHQNPVDTHLGVHQKFSLHHATKKNGERNLNARNHSSSVLTTIKGSVGRRKQRFGKHNDMCRYSSPT